jgi:hypothetical protein
LRSTTVFIALERRRFTSTKLGIFVIIGLIY